MTVQLGAGNERAVLGGDGGGPDFGRRGAGRGHEQERDEDVGHGGFYDDGDPSQQDRRGRRPRPASTPD